MVDPTTEKFPEGWCVVTLQPKNSTYQNTNLDRIGAMNADQLSCGHQMGEVVVMSTRPTDGQRYALDVTPAKLSVPNEMNVLLDGTGTGLLELLTCGGFVGEPTWTLGEAGRGKLLSDETTLRLKCSSGVIILFR